MSRCIVVVDIPRGASPKDKAIAGALASAPTYRGLADKGLISKHYLSGERGGGGVYIWESRAAAEAWYTPERLDWLEERFGVRPVLTWYDNFVVVDNAGDATLVDGEPVAETVAAE